ncbi:sulfurtransferase TusA family protein [Ancylobacter radicis]|uniref:Sulfurtransferase TusA family protein n=1 Tax=Ancylobacter radicis TaxID=2836179 RepID=A0ABS5R449_9HYPH|nr:sulfurtransferase TusA family protein [Ancylobacter radicis]MBS9476438.1 sulfurtransferase TusA family protein [Ancylobacter radicis]
MTSDTTASKAREERVIRLDLRGLKCPLPALHARRALERAAPGMLLVVACTDPMAVIDIPHMVRQSGNLLEGQEQHEGVLTFVLRKAEAAS